jgi:hypothetical protein
MLHAPRFEVFMAVKIQVEIFWVVMPYSVAVILEDLFTSIFTLK